MNHVFPYQKCIISGNLVESYIGFYDTSIYLDYSGKSSDLSILRAKKRISRYVACNAGYWLMSGVDVYYKPVFITITFKKNIIDVVYANREYSKFLMRLNVKLFNDRKARLKYSTVIEFQKRGAVHYHGVFYNFPLLGLTKAKRILEQVWGHGFVRIEPVRSVWRSALYVTKYMHKGFSDERLKSKKRYFQSRGLIKPIELRDVDAEVYLRSMSGYNLLKEYTLNHMGSYQMFSKD